MANTIKIKRRTDASNTNELGTLSVGELGVDLTDSNKLYVGTSSGNALTGLPIAGGTLTGELTSRKVAPSANNTYSSGGSNYRWSNVFSVGGDFSGNLTVAGSCTFAALSGTTADFSGSVEVGGALDCIKSGTNILTIQGSSSGYVNAGISLRATSDTHYRGLGVFMHDAGGDTEWFAGRPYADSDKYIIARVASQASHSTATAQNANALFTIYNSGNVAIKGIPYPTANNTYTLGTSANRWSTIYGAAGDISGNLTVAGSCTFAALSGTTGTFSGAVTVTGSGHDNATLSITNTANSNARLLLNSGHGNWSVCNSDTIGDALEFRDESAGATRLSISSSGAVTIGATLTVGDTLLTAGGSDANLRLRSDSSRSGLFIDKPGTTTVMGSALVLASDESYRLGTANYYHVVCQQGGGTLLQYQGNTKLTTTSTGATVTGNLSVSGNGVVKQIGSNAYSTADLNNWYTGGTATLGQFYRYNSTHGHFQDAAGNVASNAPNTLTQSPTQIYSYGALLTLDSNSSFRGQFYMAHSASEIYWRSGWGSSGDQNWTRLVGDRNIQSVIHNVGHISTKAGNNLAVGGSVTVQPGSGDGILFLKNSAASQILRLDQNSIRTTTTHNITLFTDGNSNQLRLSSNGSVGINQGSPNAANKLEVSGTVTCSSQLISAQGYTQPPVGTLTIQGPTNGGTTINSDVWGLVIGPQHTRSTTANTYYAGIAFNHLLNNGGAATYNNAPQAWIGTRLHDTSGSERGFLVFATKSGTGTSSSDVPIERMCIDPVDGFVGIGSTDPSAKLHIKDSVDNSYKSGLTIERSADGAKTYINTKGGATTFNNHNHAESAGLPYHWYMDESHKMALTSTGLGVGASNPSAKLDVRGPLGANGTAVVTSYFQNTTSGATSSAIYIGASSGTDWKIGKNVTGIANNTNFSISDHANNRFLDINSGGQVAIGTTSTAYGRLFVDAATNPANTALAVRGRDSSASYIALNVMNNADGELFSILNNGRAKFTGQVGIGVTPSTNTKLHVNGTTHSTSYKTAYTFEWSGRTAAFANGSSGLVSKLNFGNNQMWGWIEVTLTDSYSHSPTTGKLTRLYEIGHNQSTSYHYANGKVTESYGNVRGHWKLGDLELVSNNVTIPIIHRTTAGNAVTVHVRGMLHSSNGANILNDISLSTPAVGSYNTDIQYAEIADMAMSGTNGRIRNDSGNTIIDNDGELVRIPGIAVNHSTPGTHGLYVKDKTSYLKGDTGIGMGPSSSYRLSVESTNNTPARILSTTSSCNLITGSSTQSQYTNLQLNSNSGDGQIWKAGGSYTSFGGASSLNIYCSNGKIAFHPSANANKVVINTDGDTDFAARVGIGGNHNNSYQLYVTGTSYFNSGSTQNPATLYTSQSTGGNYLLFNNASGQLGYLGWGSTGNNDLYVVNQGGSNTGSIRLYAGGNTRVLVASDGDTDITGRLGVGGAHNNSYQLYVNGTSYFNNLITGSQLGIKLYNGWGGISTTLGGGSLFMGFNVEGAATGNVVQASNAHSSSAGWAYMRCTGYSTGITFHTKNGNTTAGEDATGNQRVQITGDGHVGINKTPAGYGDTKLEVNGNVSGTRFLSGGTITNGTHAFEAYGSSFESSSIRLKEQGSGENEDPGILFQKGNAASTGDHCGGIYFQGTSSLNYAIIRGTCAGSSKGQLNIHIGGQQNTITRTSNDTPVFQLGEGGLALGATPNDSYKLWCNGQALVSTNLRLGTSTATGNANHPAITAGGYDNAGIYFESSGVGLGAGTGKYLFLDSTGNININGATHAGEDWNGAIHIKNSSDIGNETSNEAVIYAEGGELKCMDDDRNRTTLSSHINGKWVYMSNNTKTGKSVKIHMEDLVKAVEEHLGVSFSEIVEGAE